MLLPGKFYPMKQLQFEYFENYPTKCTESVELLNRQLTTAEDSLREWTCCSINSPSQLSVRSILLQVPCILSNLTPRPAGGDAVGTLPARSLTAQSSALLPGLTGSSAGNRNPHQQGLPLASDYQSSNP